MSAEVHSSAMREKLRPGREWLNRAMKNRSQNITFATYPDRITDVQDIFQRHDCPAVVLVQTRTTQSSKKTREVDGQRVVH